MYLSGAADEKRGGQLAGTNDSRNKRQPVQTIVGLQVKRREDFPAETDALGAIECL